MSLIKAKINSIQYKTEIDLKFNVEKISALKSINHLLNQIDFTVEEVPINNSERLKKLLTSLKGDSLSENEIELVTEIIEK